MHACAVTISIATALQAHVSLMIYGSGEIITLSPPLVSTSGYLPSLKFVCFGRQDGLSCALLRYYPLPALVRDFRSALKK